MLLQLFAERPVQVGHGIEIFDISAEEPYCDAGPLAGLPAQLVCAKQVELTGCEAFEIDGMAQRITHSQDDE